ncbi:MAG: YqeG family HAD IIIA-type phosphatase [Eubacteriales bacterium]
MLQRFYPDHAVDSAYVIPYEELYEKGVRGIIYDIDNTLVPHGKPADKRCVDLMKRLKEIGFDITLLSNNKRPRVESMANELEVPFIEKANKPNGRNYIKAMMIMKTSIQSTIFVGDQIFTDIYGAKRVGIPSYLVKPIHKKEEFQIVLKRYLEIVVLYFYRRSIRKKR